MVWTFAKISVVLKQNSPKGVQINTKCTAGQVFRGFPKNYYIWEYFELEFLMKKRIIAFISENMWRQFSSLVG